MSVRLQKDPTIERREDEQETGQGRAGWGRGVRVEPDQVPGRGT